MKTDAEFVAALKASDAIVSQVQDWLSRRFDLSVAKPRLRIRPKAQQAQDYFDQDLWVEGKGRVEVKQRPELNFTDEKDYPFPTVIVDEQKKWERADPKPVAYVITNSTVTACIVVKTATAPYWITKTRYDKKTRAERTFVECPIRLCEFYKMKTA